MSYPAVASPFRQPFRRCFAIGLVVAASSVVLPFGASVFAQDKSATPAAPSTQIAPPAPAQVSVQGFRSAHFGMDEAALREAIAADFGVEPDAIAAADNPAERTRVLSVSVPDVLEGGGTALVSYVLGYRNKVLDQVSVLWSPQSDETLDAARLVSNASALQAYFLQSGYDPANVVTEAAVPEGVVMFRGLDQDGHMTLLLLRGTMAEAAATDGAKAPDQPQFSPSALLLAYLADPANPDVFAVPQGKF